MHEMGIALEILRICRESVPTSGRIERVVVAVGELSAVEPELLVTAWEAAVAGEPEDGAVLEIDWHPARQTCAQCGEVKDRVAGSWLRLCPHCNMPLGIEGGDELDVLRVQYVENSDGEVEDGRQTG
jgi:Zn finger protein HypA/HybF involved in hydrogenase expression